MRRRALALQPAHDHVEQGVAERVVVRGRALAAAASGGRVRHRHRGRGEQHRPPVDRQLAADGRGRAACGTAPETYAALNRVSSSVPNFR